ncbi:MAG: tetratricopeptide repeat protein, partial [Gemmatimonadaceae bacterium]
MTVFGFRLIGFVVATSLAVTSLGCAGGAETEDARGDRFFSQQNYRDAIMDYQAAEKKNPNDLHAIRQLALSFDVVGDRTSAIKYFELTRTKAPTDSVARLTLAGLYLATGRTDDALTEANAVLEKSPTNASALSVIGAANLAKNDAPKAIDALQQITAVNPKDARAQYLIGVAMLTQNNSAGATKQFETSLSIAPGYAEPLTKLVEMDLAAHQPDSAISRIKKQMVVAGYSPPMHELLGITYIAKGDTKQAEGTLLEVIRRNPRYLDPYARLSEMYRSAGNYDRALTIAGQGLDNDPNSLSLLLVRGLSYEAKGDRANARRSYERALMINPTFTAAGNSLASLLAESAPDRDSALKVITAAKAADPNNPAVTDTFGWVLYQR